jgi:hypothetical protein
MLPIRRAALMDAKRTAAIRRVSATEMGDARSDEASDASEADGGE